MAKYIVYFTEEQANAKADQEGKALNLPYWQNPDVNITRTATAPMYTDDGQWALDVTDYTTLTEEEEQATVEEINMQEIE